MFTKENAKEYGAKGGKAELSFESVVKSNITRKDLKELYIGLLESGKKGNVKATETILKYMDQMDKQKPTTLDDFINEQY